jgi:hypothetical protein
MIALLLVLALAGLYILIKGKINFSKDRILYRPKSTYLGIAFLLLAIIPLFTPAVNIFVVMAASVILIIIAYVISQKVTPAQ